jgi:hypothetical protein
MSSPQCEEHMACNFVPTQAAAAFKRLRGISTGNMGDCSEKRKSKDLNPN